MKIFTDTVIISNKKGLHARATARLCALVSRFDGTEIYLRQIPNDSAGDTAFNWEAFFLNPEKPVSLPPIKEADLKLPDIKGAIANTRSAMSLMFMAAEIGAMIEIAAYGAHPEIAVQAVKSLFEEKFSESD